ncbi:lipopolysaccharide-induced tumor necrosis factor-alpha factor homolog [Musca autumnalis]|uniref:lipopolysaccharide-induced tumor necrosis factor-alpha factor homolog n=1 Tax=Musca autumnalis TaxID=221902 RepID=UPI003CF9C288
MELPLKHAHSPPPYDKLYNINPEMDTNNVTPSTHRPAAPSTSGAFQQAPVISVNNIGTETYQPVGPKPVIMTCPQCRCRNKTIIKRRNTWKTHLACICLTCIGCCCLPYCLNACTSLDHHCPICEAYVGTFQ